jgi:hypothetical protein
MCQLKWIEAPNVNANAGNTVGITNDLWVIFRIEWYKQALTGLAVDPFECIKYETLIETVVAKFLFSQVAQ